MKLGFACPFYGPTEPLVGACHRAVIINAFEAGHAVVEDYSTDGMQHRPACEKMLEEAAKDERIDAVLWTEHDVILPPNVVSVLVKAAEETPEADILTGVVYRRSPPYSPMVSKIEPLSREKYEALKVSPVQAQRDLANELTWEETQSRWYVAIRGWTSDDPPFQVDTAAMGCLLIRRSAAQKVWDLPDLFAAQKRLSIDNAFFQGCAKRGLKLYCVPAAICGHFGEREVIGPEKWEATKREALKRIEEMEADPIEAAMLRVGRGGFYMIQQKQEIVDCARWLHENGHLGRVLEIGVHQGATAALWAELGAEVVAVDLPDGPFAGVSLEAARNRDKKLAARYPYQCVLGDSHDPATVKKVAHRLNGALVDTLFIDGDHTYEGVKQDFETYRHLVRPGGVILFHDIEDTQSNKDQGIGVPRFWRELDGEKLEFTIHADWGGLGVLRV